MLHGHHTALHDAACPHELFLLDFDPSRAATEAAEAARWKRHSRADRAPQWDTLQEVPLAGLGEAEVVEAVRLAGRPNGHQHRLEHLQVRKYTSAISCMCARSISLLVFGLACYLFTWLACPPYCCC